MTHGKITLKDCINKTGLVEKLTNLFPENETGLVGFGKYSDKSHKWIKENDLRYFDWMYENVYKFKIGADRNNL